MEALGTLGHAVGEYEGGGQGNLEPEWLRTLTMMMPRSLAMLVMLMTMMKLHRAAVNKLTLCCSSMTEATGLSIYDGHITEIAAKVAGVPLSSLSQPCFSSLVHTPHNIPKKGKKMYKNCSQNDIRSVREDWDHCSPPKA